MVVSVSPLVCLSRFLYRTSHVAKSFAMTLLLLLHVSLVAASPRCKVPGNVMLQLGVLVLQSCHAARGYNALRWTIFFVGFC